MKITKKLDYDLENGFIWIEIDNTIIQCCLKQEENKYILAIDADDNGYDWGICADANEEAFEKFGAEEAISLLIQEAEKVGIEVL